MKIYLSVSDSSGKKKSFPISELHTTMGRSSKARVPIKDDLCSGIHCKFYLESDCVFVEDTGSKNGVFLNEIKVKKQRMYVGDEVRIGSSKIKIEDKKMSPDMIQEHTSSHSNRKNGSITLELESFKEAKSRSSKKTQEQKDYVKKSKLYSGVESNNKASKKASQKLVLLERLALVIDLALTLFLVFGPLLYMNKDNKNFISGLINDPSQIIVGSNLIYSGIGLGLGVFFFTWNRNREKGTIGEQIFKI